MQAPLIDQATYERERAICDAARAYAESIMCEGGPKRRRNYLTKEEAAMPVYAACDNDMRGRVEQFELLRDMPERFSAYLGNGSASPIVIDGRGAVLPVTVWTGLPLGTAGVETVARNGQRYGWARINGRPYRWQGGGAGMIAHFTAKKRRG